jgi:hypothetical protein
MACSVYEYAPLRGNELPRTDASAEAGSMMDAGGRGGLAGAGGIAGLGGTTARGGSGGAAGSGTGGGGSGAGGGGTGGTAGATEAGAGAGGAPDAGRGGAGGLAGTSGAAGVSGAGGVPEAGQGGAAGSTGTSGAAGNAGTGGAAGTAGRGGASGAGDSGGSVNRTCPAGQFLTGIDASGNLVCASLDAIVRTTINTSCSIYAGWQDVCAGCSSPPSEWGWASGTSCQNGSGAADANCTQPNLGGVNIPLFGLSPDATINSDDKFYAGLHCAAPTGTDGQATATCPAGQFASGVSDTTLTCTSGQRAVLGYARGNCSVYSGWLNNCSNCTSPPDRWGHANDAVCTVGAGAGSTCTTTSLGGESVNLFGFNLDEGITNSKFYLGLHCAGAPADAGQAPSDCPAGQLVTGLNANGTIQCASAGGAVERYARQGCFVYWGWRDSCATCTSAPSKWGRTGDTTCANGVGSGNTCVAATIGGEAVRLFGIHVDGLLSNDDRFFYGLYCE